MTPTTRKAHETVYEKYYSYEAKIVKKENDKLTVEHITCIRRKFFTKRTYKEIASFTGKPNDPICFITGRRITKAQKAEIKEICGTEKETEYFYITL